MGRQKNNKKKTLLWTIVAILVISDLITVAQSSPSPANTNTNTNDPNTNATVTPPIGDPTEVKEKEKPKEEEKKENQPEQPEKPVEVPSSEKEVNGTDHSKSDNDTPKEETTAPLPPTSPPPPLTQPNEEVKEKSEEVEEKSEEKGKAELPPAVGSKESCEGVENRCQDSKALIACLKGSDDASKALLLIQNTADNSLRVDLLSPGNKQRVIDVPKLQSEKVNISFPIIGSHEIRLNAGNGDCVLHLGAPVLQGNFFKRLPSYSKFMTPMYGAYVLIATTLIAGGICALCWFRRRKKESDIPYQELELSVPETAAAAETAEGWDQGWDDDWDEEKAVKTPGGLNISANGLTSRTPNKDGWEDWDD